MLTYDTGVYGVLHKVRTFGLAQRFLKELHSVNGCSMKTAEQLEMIQKIPLEKLLLETGTSDEINRNISLTRFLDAPWCSLTGGHASKHQLASLPTHLRNLYMPAASQPDRWQEGKAVKGRNEPCAIGAVAYVVSQYVLHSSIGQLLMVVQTQRSPS